MAKRESKDPQSSLSSTSPKFTDLKFIDPSSWLSHPGLKAMGFDKGRLKDWRAEGLSSSDAFPSRVIFESREHYRVSTPLGEASAEPAGRLRLGDLLPVVGDWVWVDGLSPTDAAQQTCRIVGILPRRTSLSRKVPGEKTVEQVVAANVDTVFLVMGLDGDFNLRRLERFVVMIHESGASPVVVLTKEDLHDDPVEARLDAQTAAPGVPVYGVSSLQGKGLEPLQVFLEPGKTVAMVGSSGAGKSTLLNALNGEDVMKTGAVRASDDRGRHTTTHRQLVLLKSGGLLVDNPGVREIQLWAEDSSLDEAFHDIAELARACRFRDCSHNDEPGCAVRRALDDGTLSPERFRNWQGLEKELRHLESRRDVVTRRREDKKLGQLYKRVQEGKRKNRFR